ncbi:MAG: aminotransferase class V-fold PLP-dependent enzyme [Pseudomonadota bacterium]
MQEQLDILQRVVKASQKQTQPVGNALPAAELLATLDLSLGQEGSDIEQLEKALLDYVHYSPNVAHPEYFKLLYSGLNKEALLGDWVASLNNSTMHTYQVGPVATLMELELLEQFARLVGYTEAEGVMVSGGSQANIVGMMLARHRACPDFKDTGYSALGNKRLIAYVSDQSHYSNQRAVNVLGIGSDNLRSVESDEQGRMIPKKLEQAIAQDVEDAHVPFFIGLTAGTTVTGAYDPVRPTREIADKYGMWLHIDGAWGAPVLFSERHKHLLADSQLADSFAWDAHKFMNVPITAGVILVKHKGALKECTAGGGGDYLFHADQNAQFNLGERSLQCGRRADALKVWLSWKAVGTKGFANKLDYLQYLKQDALQLIKQQPQLQILAEAAYLNVLFRFYHPDLNEEKSVELNIKICQFIRESGGAYVDYAKYKGRTGIRLILANKETQISHVQKLTDQVVQAGNQLVRELN